MGPTTTSAFGLLGIFSPLFFVLWLFDAFAVRGVAPTRFFFGDTAFLTSKSYLLSYIILQSNSKQNEMPKAVEDCHTLLAWIIPHLDGFSRARRFTLGERIETRLLQVLERLIEAAYQRDRSELLKSANLDLDVVRHLWRLSHTLRAISDKSYGQGAERMTELGRQIGGWRKFSKNEVVT